ncbi:Nucleic-acid-binding protein from mobile element jockey [Orchesella cincta]|uniref:Nucleic-acid-binding protein from mobile element jockey n=1 Tax=Orchesella cincta TaxID=48709 RepID=A0A1D2MJT0_ORCCI|nr:Nucleic-acid-binding protein from mobile element jockey [Orchesella cincta]
MPTEVEEGSTPIKPKWNSSAVSMSSNTSLNFGEPETSFSKSYLDGSKMGDIEEDILTTELEAETSCMSVDENETSGASSSSVHVKSRLSGDSGISSLGVEHLHHEVVSTPKRESPAVLPDFKHKISIYSKVSGCRMTNLTDYWIVKQVRVAILQRLTDGDPVKTLSYKFGYEKMANGGLQIISDSQQLIEMLGNLSYFAGIPCKMTFPDTPRVVGFIKGLPTDLEPSDLKDEIRKTYPQVYSVRYVTEKSRGFAHGIQRPCAFISFNLKFLPKSVKIFEETFELQVPNPMQCTRCCRYGHQGKQCRAQARCSFCGGTHQRQLCTAKAPSCINCQGEHTATSHDCVIWQQGKLMNELRYRGGMSAESAIGIASSGKISQKKHNFIQADFFEEQENYFCGRVENLQGDDDVEDAENQPAPSPKGKVSSVHPRTFRTFPFLDLMTDFFLRAKNPGSNYNSSILMPGYDDLGFPVNRKSKKNTAVAQHFKQTVMAMIDDSPIRYGFTNNQGAEKRDISFI